MVHFMSGTSQGTRKVLPTVFWYTEILDFLREPYFVGSPRPPSPKNTALALFWGNQLVFQLFRVMAFMQNKNTVV